MVKDVSVTGLATSGAFSGLDSDPTKNTRETLLPDMDTTFAPPVIVRGLSIVISPVVNTIVKLPLNVIVLLGHASITA